MSHPIKHNHGTKLVLAISLSNPRPMKTGRPIVNYLLTDSLIFLAAASIWFEIWGSWIRVKNFDFSIHISEKFRFFQTISQNILIFPDKVLKNFVFSGKFSRNFDFFRQF